MLINYAIILLRKKKKNLFLIKLITLYLILKYNLIFQNPSVYFNLFIFIYILKFFYITALFSIELERSLIINQ